MKKISLLLGVPLIWAACSSDSSSSAAEGAASADVASSSSTKGGAVSSVSYGIDPLDSARQGGTAQSVELSENVTSSSMTSYTFRTEYSELYSSFSPCFLGIVAFYEERGARVIAGDKNGSYEETFRLLEDASGVTFTGWLWYVSYRHQENTGKRDRSLFEERCASYLGEYKNYRDETTPGDARLELSCVFPRNVNLSDKEYLDSIALAEKDFVGKYWNDPEDEIEPESSLEKSEEL